MANGAPLPVWAKEALKYGGVGGGAVGAVLLVWIAIAQPMREDFRTFQQQQIEASKASAARMDSLKEEFTRFRADFTEWTRQVFVSRDLYDQRRAETDRRMALLESEVAEMRKGK